MTRKLLREFGQSENKMGLITVKKQLIALGSLMLAGMLLLGLSGCGANATTGDQAQSGGKIEVVATINQWGSVAQDLGGNFVHVSSIMTNTNVDAHEYEPTSQDVAQFSKANIVVVNGADYDSWGSKAAKSTHAQVVDAAETAGKKDGDNPHVWFSAQVRKTTADAITKAYQSSDPQHKSEYEQLNKQWQTKEQALEQTIAKAAEQMKGKHYAATESVAWYLANDLEMTDATPKGYAQASANESEPTPSDITEFQHALETGNIAMLVFNTQEASSVTEHITSAAKQNKVPIVDVTEQMPAQYHHLIDWMSALVDEFAAAQHKA